VIVTFGPTTIPREAPERRGLTRYDYSELAQTDFHPYYDSSNDLPKDGCHNNIISKHEAASVREQSAGITTGKEPHMGTTRQSTSCVLEANQHPDQTQQQSKQKS